MFTQTVKFYTFHCHILKGANIWPRWLIKQTENERSLLAATFTAEFESVFVLTQESAFYLRFDFKANRTSIGSTKKRYPGIFKIALCFRDWHVFMWQSVEILNVFNAVNFETNFLKKEKLFEKTGITFFIWKY